MNRFLRLILVPTLVACGGPSSWQPPTEAGADTYDAADAATMADASIVEASVTDVGSSDAVTRRSIAAFDGNSIVKGWWAQPLSLGFAPLSAAQFPGWDYSNRGMNGFTTPEVDAVSKEYTDPLFDAARSHNIVVALEGVNDWQAYARADAGYAPSEIDARCIADFKTYVGHRHAVGWIVVLLTLLPSYIIPEADRTVINDAIRQPGFTDVVADVGADPVIGVASALDDTSLFVGRLHPATRGHAIMVPTVAAAITRAAAL